MLTNHSISRPLLALAAALAAAPLGAQAPVTVTGQPIHRERVSFGDLDLSSMWAQKELRDRVRDASQRVCIEAEGPFTNLDPGDPRSQDYGRTCAQMTYDSTRPYIAAAIRRARSGQPQVATALVITAPVAMR